MEICFLGTSAGIPTKSRNVTAAILRRKQSKSWYLIDCGEGTQQQLLQTKNSLNQLQAIFITHMHGDHCLGLPGLLSSATMKGRTAPLMIVGPQELELFVTHCLNLTHTRMKFELIFKAVESSDFTFQDQNFTVEKIVLSHRVASYGYVFVEIPRKAVLDVNKLKRDNIPEGPLWGQIRALDTVVLEDGRTIESQHYLQTPQRSRRVIICGDNDNPELVAKCVGRPDVLIHEATYTETVAKKIGPGPQHSSALRVAKFAHSHGIANLILTHFSSRYEASQSNPVSIDEIDDEAKSIYEGKLYLARDFDVFHLSNNSELSRVSEAKR